MRAALDSGVCLATEPHAAHQRNKNAVGGAETTASRGPSTWRMCKDAASPVTALRT